MWIGLVLSYLMLLKVSELFAEGDGRAHAVYCFKGEDMKFYACELQLEEGQG